MLEQDFYCERGGGSTDHNKPLGTYWEIYFNLRELYITSFKWENLPASVNERYLELSLFNYGRCVFFNDPLIGHLVLKATMRGNLDHYYEPKLLRAFGGNGYQKNLTNHEDSAVIYNNYNRDIPHIRILDYAKRIYAIERAMDVNVNAQKTPFILTGNKNQVHSLKQMYKKIDDNEYVIIKDNAMSDDAIQVLETNAPYVAGDLQELKKDLWNEALSFIGIENNSSEKNERLTQGEVLVSNGLAKSNRNSRYRARNKAIEEINVLFSLDINIEYTNPSVLEDSEGQVKVDNPLVGGEDPRE